MRLHLLKSKENAALPSVKKGIITLIHIDEIIAMPKTDYQGIRCLNEIQLKENPQLQYLYLTPFTQKEEITPSGDIESTLFSTKISGTFPGNKIEAAEFLKQNINEPFVIIYEDFTENTKFIYGSKYHPLFIKSDYKSDSTGKLWNFTLEQSHASDTPYLYYDGPQLGGRNLIINSTNDDTILLYGVTATRENVIDNQLPSKNYFKFTNVVRTDGNFVFYIPTMTVGKFSQSLIGKKIQISFHIRSNNSQKLVFERDGSQNFMIDSTWKKVRFNAVINDGNLHFFLEGSGISSFDISSVKIEFGDVATDWTPAPEDIIM